MRKQLSGAILSLIAQWHGSMRTLSFGVRRTIPLRGRMAISLIQRGGRMPSWKSSFLEAFEIGDDGCFVDVGTSVGQTLLEYKSVHPKGRYFGFDPNPSAIAYLNELIGANGLDDCQSFCFAASDKVGPAILLIDAADEGNTGASLVKGLRPGVRQVGTGVAMLPLDSALEFIEPARVKLMKIDVEGAELFAIRGMRRLLSEHRPVITCEVLFVDPKADPAPVEARNAELFALLTELGYRVYQIVKQGEARGTLRLRALDAFPTGRYDETTAHLCDYVFAPAGTELPFAMLD